MKSNIRSKYIKDFLNEKEEMKNQFSKQATETIRDILGETVKGSLKELISEADEDDSYEEEEAVADNALATDSPSDSSAENADAEVADDKVEDEKDDAADLDADADDEADDADDTAEDDSLEIDTLADDNGDDVWDDMEQYKDENGEYDLTGMDNADVIRVLKVMNPETDGVRVVKNDNGQLDVTVPASDDEVEFIIDLDGDNNDENESDEMIFEENLGYTDSYQNKTAMTTLPNKEVADKKNTYSMDGGVPEGDSKPWVGKAGDMSPFSQNVNESECENMFEIELDDEDDEIVDEGLHTVTHGSVARGVTSTYAPDEERRRARNFRNKGQQETQTTESPITENFKRKLNAVLEENKELRQIAEALKKRLNEEIQVNYSLGKVVKLVSENTTSRQEKVDIIARFDKARNLDEAKTLYETIDRELKSNRPVAKNNGVMQLAESKNNVKETSIYKSDDLKECVNLMNRVDSLGKR